MKSLALNGAARLEMLKMSVGEFIKEKLVSEKGGNSHFDDGGATGWLKGQGISVVIIIILLAAVTAFVPQFWTKVMGYINGLF